ncbi:hypothetical protein [Hanstruepera ponticola]|uniref:hypothetical protein n=1 Tax=Hanstruepera ponticola TaxID=2042995 RepID=UPI00177AB40F|nr:hypothetical protein [Hanstruepera ponticola]
MSYKRILGGEKNLKSGQRWTKDEIIKVYHLYKRLNGVGLHEHNPEIQHLAQELGRTVRSTEAQTLMFRNLEKNGNYSHGNMNKLSKQVWNEYELKRNSQIAIAFKDDQSIDPIQVDSSQDEEDNINHSIDTSEYVLIEDEENNIERYIFDYKKWNKLLVEHYFNANNEDEEIQCFFIYTELFEELSDSQFTYCDFELSIEKILRSKSFKDKFNELYLISIPKVINGRNLRKPIPEYFGLLMYLILSLTDSKSENLSVTNVYNRINEVGKNRFKNKWENINTSFARDVLELAWNDLEDWSKNYKSKSLGYFNMKDPKNPLRKYVSRIERHALFNSGHFQQLFDVLIEIGIVPKEHISFDKWIEIFTNNKHKISNSDKVIEYLKEDSELKDIILKFIDDYYQINYVDTTISSPSATVRKPSIPLLLCLKELPHWDNVIDMNNIHFRAFSSELEEDHLKFQDAIIKVQHEYKEYSKEIKFDWNPNQENTLLFQGDNQRYSVNFKFRWLIANRDLEEWVEVMAPTNAQNILIFVNSEILDSILSEDELKCDIYKSPWDNFSFIEFENLNESQFDKLLHLLRHNQKVEGKIELIGDFLLNRRRLILKEFDNKFRYSGPVADPKLFVKIKETGEEMELIKDSDEDNLFSLDQNINESEQFYVYENSSKVRSHFSFEIGSLRHKDIVNICRPYSKDEDGINIIEREIQSDDIFDIPNDFNKDSFDTVDFNTWHGKVWKIFKPGIVDYVTSANQTFNYSEKHIGEKLLNYLAVVNNVDTYKFPLLIRELNPMIDSKFSKRIMHYWKDLGYINFETYGDRIKVSPSNLLFIKTEKGLKAFLTGFRNHVFIKKLIQVCDELNLIINLTSHSEKYENILPNKIEIYDKLGDLHKFKTLSKRIGVEFINNIENPLNRSFAIYQFACFYTQRSIEDFDKYLHNKLDYKTDHHRKLEFIPETSTWKETNKNVSDMVAPTLIRYDGFKDRQVVHIYKDESGSKILENYALASFKLIKTNIFLRKQHKINPVSDFFVPLNKTLPFWIERGLILINAEIPIIEWIDNKAYRKYQNIHDDIITIIENKLNQTAKTIN